MSEMSTIAPVASKAVTLNPAPFSAAPYFCCKGRQFHLYSSLMKHIKSEHYLKPIYYCMPCRLAVTTSAKIARHKEVVHEGKVKFLCALCKVADYRRLEHN
jgi:hypothetical protein